MRRLFMGVVVLTSGCLPIRVPEAQQLAPVEERQVTVVFLGERADPDGLYVCSLTAPDRMACVDYSEFVRKANEE